MTDKKQKKRFASNFAIIFNPYIQLGIRIIVGLMLIYFSYHKFSAPLQWSEVVYQYRLIPFALVNIVSTLLMGLEMVAGLCILFGVFSRAAAIVGGSVVLIFLAALQINILKEVYIYCGCFKKQAYFTDVTYSNRNITFFVLLLIVLLILNKNPRFTVDNLISKLIKK